MIEPINAMEMAEEYREARATMLGAHVPPSLRIVAEEAAQRGVTIDQLRSPRRERTLVHHRQEIMARLRAETKLSLPQIGRIFRRDHSTVLHSLAAVERRASDREAREHAEQIAGTEAG